MCPNDPETALRLLRRLKARHSLPLVVAALLSDISTSFPAEAAKRQINLLFIITDQQRFDALGCAGNPVLKTPNLDRLAREGARFVNAYSSCPVCVPARTVILTGRCIESTRVRGNHDLNSEDVPDLLTFDQVLLRHGYQGEYHGKWHSPYKFALDYTRPVLWLNGKQAVKYVNTNFPGDGPIGLQIHPGLDMKVEFRNVRAKALE